MAARRHRASPIRARQHDLQSQSRADHQRQGLVDSIAAPEQLGILLADQHTAATPRSDPRLRASAPTGSNETHLPTMATKPNPRPNMNHNNRHRLRRHSIRRPAIRPRKPARPPVAPRLVSDYGTARPRQEIAPGIVHVPNWLPLDQQVELVRLWGSRSRYPARRDLPNGSDRRHERPRTIRLGGADVLGKDSPGDALFSELPAWLTELGQRALIDAYRGDGAACYRPNRAVLTYHPTRTEIPPGRDQDDHDEHPLVSLFVGADCLYRFPSSSRPRLAMGQITLRSGDLFVHPRLDSRSLYSNAAIVPGTNRALTGLSSGQLDVALDGSPHQPA